MTLELQYDPAALTSAARPTALTESELKIFKLEGSAWTEVSGSSVDTVKKLVQAQVSSFGSYAVLGVSPVVTSVTVGGPSSGKLKIGATAAFTATAKDQNGAEISGVSFEWSSSDASTASVDSGGVVTARKLTRGTNTVTITARAAGVSGSSAAFTTYGLEVAGGTWNRSPGPIGTTFFAKFRNADGSVAPSGSGFTVTGPGAWGNLTLGLSGSAGWITGKTAVTGAYTATITVNGESFASSFNIDATSTLPITANVGITNVSASQADVTWTLNAQATSYIVRIYDGNRNNFLKAVTVPASTSSASIIGLTLEVGKTYPVSVDVYESVVTVGGEQFPPDRYNVSSGEATAVAPGDGFLGAAPTLNGTISGYTGPAATLKFAVFPSATSIGGTGTLNADGTYSIPLPDSGVMASALQSWSNASCAPYSSAPLTVVPPDAKYALLQLRAFPTALATTPTGYLYQSDTVLPTVSGFTGIVTGAARIFADRDTTVFASCQGANGSQFMSLVLKTGWNTMIVRQTINAGLSTSAIFFTAQPPSNVLWRLSTSPVGSSPS